MGGGSKFPFLSFFPEWKVLDMFLVLWEGICGETQVEEAVKAECQEEIGRCGETEADRGLHLEMEKTGKDGVGKVDFQDCLISTLELSEI